MDLSPAKGLKEPVAAKASRPSLPFGKTHTSPCDISSTYRNDCQFVCGMDFGNFPGRPEDGLLPVERKLPLISEGAMRLGEDAERLCPGLAVHNIRGIGNWLRHRYDRVDVERCGTRSSTISALRSGVLRALTAAPANPRVGARLKPTRVPEPIPHPGATPLD